MRTALLAELDDLVLTVRDRNSRSYILEAINAYRAEAYRAAIISTWVAVTYDVISKVRELATQGDAEAKKVVEGLDKDIDAQERGDASAVARFQKFENELLDKALTKFEFVSRQEHVDLSRLKDDRNLCTTRPSPRKTLSSSRSRNSSAHTSSTQSTTSFSTHRRKARTLLPASCRT